VTRRRPVLDAEPLSVNQSPLVPLPYQVRDIAAVLAALDKPGSRPLVIIPTGGGKSVEIAGLAEAILARNPAARMLVIARSHVLADHNVNALARLDPAITRASFKGKPLSASVTYATAQKLYRHPDIVASADLVIIDECDQSFLEGAKQYGAILKAARCYCGLTGTPFRLVKGETVPIFGEGPRSGAGAGAPFDPPCAFVRKQELIDLGRILPITAIAGSTALDVSRVRLDKYGTFDTRVQSKSAGMLATIVSDVRAALDVCPTPFLVYCSTIEQATLQAAALTEGGIPTGVIDGTMPKAKRDDVDAKFRAGELPGVCSVMTIDRGYDHPEVGLVVIAFASISRTRVEQIAGRVMRVAPGKTSARLLDYGEHGKRFGSFNFDYEEAIAFDRKRKAERETAKKVERLKVSAPRTHLINPYARGWFDFTEAELPIEALSVEPRVARKDGRRFVYVHVLTPNGWLERHWLGSADYNGFKAKEFLDALGALRPPGYAAMMNRFEELPHDKAKIAFVEETTRAAVPWCVKTSPSLTTKLRQMLDQSPIGQSRPFNFSVENLKTVIEGAALSSRVLARRIRDDYKDRLVIAPCAFRRDGRLHEFNDAVAVTNADLTEVARASEPAVSAEVMAEAIRVYGYEVAMEWARGMA
jgi:superfamily II DNA or RNA helicase